MEAKPFSIQPPEEIAKVYGGDKQRIMQAAQMGIVDPTAALLAGMFIDRMRAPQGLEGANPPTVAQQVFNGAPPQGSPPPAPQGPQGSPMPPAGGLGATPEAGAMAGPPPDAGQQMPMDMGAPPQGMAEGGMAAPYAGGLSELPVPDTMFDEPRNGGYAGGGLIAFADGGALGPWMEDEATKAIPGIAVTSRQRSAAKNAMVGGVRNSFHLTNNARDFVPPQGVAMPALYAKLKSLYGPDFDVLNEGDHIHVEPGPKKGMQANASYTNRTAKPLDPVDPANRDQRARTSLLDDIGLAKDLYSDTPHTERDKAKAYYNEQLTSEHKEKERKADMWSALAELGGTLASTPGPFLAALGSSISQTMPGVNASRKARKDAERDAIRGLMDIEGLEHNDAKDVIELGKDLWAADMSSEERQQALAAQIREKQKDRQFESDQKALDRANALDVVRSRPTNPSDLETKVAWVIQAGLAKGPVDALKYLKDNGYLPAAPAGSDLNALRTNQSASGQPQTTHVGDWND